MSDLNLYESIITLYIKELMELPKVPNVTKMLREQDSFKN